MGHADDAPLGYLLYRVQAALRPEVTAALSPLGLTLPEFVCLRILSQSPGSSSADLARQASVTPQAMNTVLRKLQDLGVVERPASVSSGRVTARVADRPGPGPADARGGGRARGGRPPTRQTDRGSAARVQSHAGEVGIRLSVTGSPGFAPTAGPLRAHKPTPASVLLRRWRLRASCPPASRRRIGPAATRSRARR